MRQRTTSILLVILTVAFGAIVYPRARALQSVSAPRVAGPYATEESWIVNEIVRDIAETAAYPRRITPPRVTATGDDGRYQVVSGTISVDVDLRDEVWAPARFNGVARSALASGAAATPSTDPFQPVSPTLLAFTPAVLVDADGRISRALTANVRSAPAHEAAALLLGAFAMREAAGRFGDTRWALNRMTAHLAIAQALEDAPGVDGRIADALLLSLTNRQVRALAAIDALQRDGATESVKAWARSLRMRVTQDWRQARPTLTSASRLEKEEYLRAHRATVPGSLALVDLNRVHASADAQWIRLVENSSVGVGDGWIGVDAMVFEQDEYRGVLQRMRVTGFGRDEIAALNARAPRCVSADGLRVLPWGAWAESSQRHLLMFIDRTDRFYRKLQVNVPEADRQQQRLTDTLGGLTLFPVATVFWTKGPRGSEADLRYLKEAVAASMRFPERITPEEWAFQEMAIHYEPVAGGMTRPADWFMGASARVTQNATVRLRQTGHDRGPTVTTAILKEAPYDSGVVFEYLTMKYGVRKPYAEMRTLLGPRLEYDTRALLEVHAVAPNVDDRLAILRTACDLSPRNCATLGWELVYARRNAEAAAAYRRAFDDPEVDAVEVANASGWLVNYYFVNGRVDDALALARLGADTHARVGLLTLARLQERLSHFDEAEALYRQAASNYSDRTDLLGFYYRGINIRKDSRYQEAWKTELAPVFPQGLLAPPTGGGRPVHGVAINSDSWVSRRAGLFIGDLIVGVEGIQVENLTQYRTANNFFDKSEMSLTVSRGDEYLKMNVFVPGRNLDVELRSFPIEGYKEK